MIDIDVMAYRQAVKDMKDEYPIILDFKNVPLLDIPEGYTTWFFFIYFVTLLKTTTMIIFSILMVCFLAYVYETITEES